MSRKQVSTSMRSRGKARQVRREAREVREMLKMPVETRRGADRRAAENKRRLFKACGWLGGLAAVITAGWMLAHKAFYDNPEFMLKHIEAVTDGTLTKQELLKTAQIPAAINLLEIDLAAIDGRLRERSQVKDVRVRRKVPDTLEITVWERTPVAWLGYQGADLDKRQNGVLLDEAGYAICCHTLYREFYDFPMIMVPRDVISEFVLFGDRVDIPSVDAALSLVKLWPAHSPSPSLQIVQIDASRHYRLEVDCQPDMRLVFQPENLSGQMLKLGDALRHAEFQNRYFSQVDLTVADNIPVIYHDDGFSPEIQSPSTPSSLNPAPRWQPRPSINNSLSDEELKAILSVDS
jgi:hypothetical protein